MRLARWSLGLVLVGMAAGQLSDLGGFVDVLATYDVLPSGTYLPVALGLAGAELVSGAGLLLGPRHHARACSLAVGVAVLWAALAAQAFARGLVLANCGCFGVHLAQPLWWGVLVQDAAFVASALWVANGLRHAGGVDRTTGRPVATTPLR